MRSNERTKRVKVVSLALIATWVILNLLMVFGHERHLYLRIALDGAGVVVLVSWLWLLEGGRA